LGIGIKPPPPPYLTYTRVPSLLLTKNTRKKKTFQEAWKPCYTQVSPTVVLYYRNSDWHHGSLVKTGLPEVGKCYTRSKTEGNISNRGKTVFTNDR